MKQAAAFGAILSVGWAAGSPAPAQERIAVDRWLVSTPFAAGADEDPLAVEYLSGGGEASVLPDRGRNASGADWTLVRADSTWVFGLPTVVEVDADSLSEGSTVPVVAYAHAYIRAPEDRTVRLMWGGQACTRVSAWLNGRPVEVLGQPAGGDALPGIDDARAAEVRIGYGYNTLLIKAAQGDCSFGLAAGLEAIADGSLDGVRVRASRPYGDTRTGPEQWVVAAPDAGPEAILAWRGDELFGAAAVRLTAFSVTAVGDVELKAKVSGRQIKRTVEWLEPAMPHTVLMPFEFGRLQRAGVRDEGLELELKWGGGEWKGALSMRPEPLLEAFRSPIRLLGWTGPRAPTETGIRDADEEADEPHPLANVIPYPEAGETLVGEWKVPGWLSGFSLVLDTGEAPGRYRLASIPVEGSEITLCTDCRKGETLQVVVDVTEDWSSFPGVLVVDAAAPGAGTDPAGSSAAEWLGWIDEKGSRRYRERAAAAAGRND